MPYTYYIDLLTKNIIFFIILYAMSTVGLMKMFKKANVTPWFAFIPFLNLYIIYKLCWDLKTFIIFIAVFLLATVIATIAAMNKISILALIAAIMMIVIVVLTIMQCLKLANSYGRKKGFGVAMFFFAPISFLVLGFGNAEYKQK